MKNFLNRVIKKVNKETIPAKIKSNFIKIDENGFKKIENSLETNFFKGWRKKEYFSDEIFDNELKTQLYSRLDRNRFYYIPWICKNIDLKGKRILEIGCGTGSSTVALAEQKANVTGIDLDEDSLKVAKDRMDVYGLKAEFICANANDVFDSLRDQKFDIIIFYASLEHMDYNERIDALKKYYSILEKNSFLIVIETPNRLWYFDEHTSLLPYFNWLPDRLAYDYAKFSKRNNFSNLYNDFSEKNFEHFLRRGRGVSYHEFQIAFEVDIKDIKVVSHLKSFFLPFSTEYRFFKILKSITPYVSEGFFYPFLNIIIRK